MESTPPPASTLQLLVSLPWGGPQRTRVLSVPGSSKERGPLTAGALLAPVLKEVEEEMKRTLPPLVATYRGKRCVRCCFSMNVMGLVASQRNHTLVDPPSRNLRMATQVSAPGVPAPGCHTRGLRI